MDNINNDFEDINKEKCEPEENNSYNIKHVEKYDGEIVVISTLECGKEEYLEGVKINLYKINGLSPILIDSKMTDSEGKAVFSNVENGSYRVIELVDKRYFDKPKYIKWNEINIDVDNMKHKIVVVNKIKKFIAKNKNI